MPRGSGVEVLHRSLMEKIPGYRLRTYSPWWSLFPPSLAAFSRGRADLVHAGADYGLFFKRPGVPLVVTLHNYTSDRFMRPYSSILQYLHYRGDQRLFTLYTLRAAAAVVANSRFIAELVTSDLSPNCPIRLIYNGVDEEHFVPSQRPESISTSRRFRVLFCGNLNRRKRALLLPRLAEALGSDFEIHYTAGLSDADATFGRIGPDAAELCPLGRVEYRDMPAVYQSMNVLFMPSVREGFGLCVAEAMSCGLPVVACGESALPELVVDGEGGYLCPVDELRCYADAIRTLAQDSDVVRRMGDFNRARVEQLFTLSRMVGEYRLLFEEVLDGGLSR